jgi:chromatin remodeling complex protein RSC6
MAGSALKQPQKLAPILAEFVGAETMSRGDVTKKIWEHIKANNLQNPENKREIICDEKLKKLFGMDRITMFKIASVTNPYFLKS